MSENVWEEYAEDESKITVRHKGFEDYRLSCDGCRWSALAGGETQANELVMGHVLEHDIAYEENLADDPL